MKTKSEIKQALRQFTGTEAWHRHLPGVLLTDGTKYLAEECGAYWLMDVIASHIPSIPKDETFTIAQRRSSAAVGGRLQRLVSRVCR